MTPTVGPATPDDRDAAVSTVVAAFAEDPAFRYFFPDPHRFAADAAALAGALFDARVVLGTIWITPGATAVAMWEPPHDPHHAGRAGPDLSALDAATLERIDRYDDAVHRAMPPAPYWYLGVLATHPDHAGRRLGRAVMATGLDRARAEGVTAVLETTNPRNVELYQRSGWQVHAEVLDGPLPIWVLETGA